MSGKDRWWFSEYTGHLFPANFTIEPYFSRLRTSLARLIQWNTIWEMLVYIIYYKYLKLLFGVVTLNILSENIKDILEEIEGSDDYGVVFKVCQKNRCLGVAKHRVGDFFFLQILKHACFWTLAYFVEVLIGLSFLRYG